MFNDPDFKLPAGVDKRGRKVRQEESCEGWDGHA